MPVINRVADLADEIAGWRRDLHENPELLFDVHRTAGVVADKLKAFGCDEVVTGIGRTGVVGVIKGKRGASGKVDRPPRRHGRPADRGGRPALPYKSKTPGKMHACGHDGHTAMLLGAAKYLAETRNFDGTAIMIFQPAEEGGGGGDVMVKDGLMERFGVQEVYGLHNMPGIPVGKFAIRPGPHDGRRGPLRHRHRRQGRPCGAAARMRRHASRRLPGGHRAAVDRLAQCRPARIRSWSRSARLQGGRSLQRHPADRDALKGTCAPSPRRCAISPRRASGRSSRAICAAFGAKASVDYRRGYPVTVNHPEQTDFIAKVAAEVGAGERAVDTTIVPLMGAEDFSYMLESRPGAYIFMGNGDTASVHHPKYNFNDEAIPYGVSLWAKMIETAMPAR